MLVTQPIRLDRKCEVCGTAFTAWAKKVQRGCGRFCSRPCQCVWQTSQRVVSLQDKFRKRLGATTPTGCILWAGSFDDKGYGRLHLRNGAFFFAHRLAWELAKGAPPGDLCVCHRCDNPACVNVEHLFLGTRADNNADMVTKGRQRPGRMHGEAASKAKLTDDRVLAIRKRYAEAVAAGGRDDGTIRRELAAAFGVHHVTIRRVVMRRNWKHI